MKTIFAFAAAVVTLTACAANANALPERSYTISVDGPTEGLELRLQSRMEEICGSRADETRERMAGRPPELRRECIAKLHLDGAQPAEIRAAFERAKAKL